MSRGIAICGPRRPRLGLCVGFGRLLNARKLSAIGNRPNQHRKIDALLSTPSMRSLAERDDLNSPQLSSRTDAEREAKRAQVNGKLYTVAKAEFDKSCLAVANAPAGSVVR
jgi:hypothetical protein